MIKLLIAFAPAIITLINLFSGSKEAAAERTQALIDYMKAGVDKQKHSVNSSDSKKWQKIKLQEIKLKRIEEAMAKKKKAAN